MCDSKPRSDAFLELAQVRDEPVPRPLGGPLGAHERPVNMGLALLVSFEPLEKHCGVSLPSPQRGRHAGEPTASVASPRSKSNTLGRDYIHFHARKPLLMAASVVSGATSFFSRPVLRNLG